MDHESIEYIVKRKTEGKLLAIKILLASAYVLLFATLVILTVNLTVPLLHIPFILLATAFVALTVFVTWRFTCIEYEIVIAAGEMTFTVIYGKGIRKRLCSVPVNSFGEIGIYDDGAYERLSRTSLQKNYLCISSLASPDLAYAVFNEGKDTAVVYFDANERTLLALRRSNPSAYRKSVSTQG